MNTLSKRLQKTLLGGIEYVIGGTPLRASLQIPLPNGCNKMIYWEGNKGLIIHLFEKIEKLEDEIEELISKVEGLKTKKNK